MGRLLPRAAEEATPTEIPRVRAIHPWAWWLWGLAAAVVASLAASWPTLLLTGAAVVLVVKMQRPRAQISFHLQLAILVVVMRLFFRILLGGPAEGTVLFTLPQVDLPDWAAGIQLGGPVTAEELLYSATDAARLGAIVLAVGAASLLADPRAALRSVPAALHDLSTAIVITCTVLPQLVTSAARVNRAQRLRGHSRRGLRASARVVVPVLEEAVEGSLSLAASMEVRGYGRTRGQQRVGRGTTGALLASLLALILGACALLGLPPGQARWLGLAPEHWLTAALLAVGATAGMLCLRRAGRRLAVTRYRPVDWGPRGWAITTIALGSVTAALAGSFGEPACPALLAVPALLAPRGGRS